MQGGRRSGWRWDGFWLLFCMAASTLWCVTAARQLSATFDEPTYLDRGLERWRTGSYAGLMHLGTMPLPVDVETLPLYLRERWQGRTFDPVRDMDAILPWARTAALPFWWLLLVYGWLTGRHLAGPWGGRLAVALLACEPTLLAHASLATTDIAITACLLALAYHFAVGRDAGWFKRLGLPALWFAAAVLAKASGLVFGPMCLGVIELHRYLQRPRQESGGCEPPEEHAVTANASPSGGSRPPLAPIIPFSLAFVRSCWRDFAIIFGAGMLLVFLYVSSDWRAEPSFVKWSETLPDGTAARSLRWVANHLCIFTNAGEGLVQQIKHNIRSHGGAYLLGEESPRAFWYYFPVALSMKLSLLVLLAPLLILVHRPRAFCNWACLCAGLLLVFSLNCRVQIGVRLVLPLVGLAIVGLAAALVETGQALAAPRRGTMFAGLIALGVAGTGFSAAAIWPEGLCYVNRLWGGWPNGYRLLSDSNYDWGQGVEELRRWSNEHQTGPMNVWYFGGDPLNQPGLQTLPLHQMPIEKPADVLCRVQGRYLAVSMTLLYGRISEAPGHRSTAAFLRSCTPVARTTTFFIYDFRSYADGSSATAGGSARSTATVAAVLPRPRRAAHQNPSAATAVCVVASSPRACAVCGAPCETARPIRRRVSGVAAGPRPPARRPRYSPAASTGRRGAPGKHGRPADKWLHCPRRPVRASAACRLRNGG
jgi:hypothetical protein